MNNGAPLPLAPLGKRIVFAGKALRARFEEALAANGASLPTFFVLTSARESSGLSQTELAERVGVESPTLVRHLDRLCAEGFVVRVPDDRDRRVTRIQLTAAGLARQKELATVAAALDRDLRRIFSAHELAVLDRVLARLAAFTEESHDFSR
ncbi:MAG TPA: MarR family transcriptional regulator [Acidimicrobiales bacterium]|nr:MarR family transcriptional regulator [Acidimicrobiales bacterium]